MENRRWEGEVVVAVSWDVGSAIGVVAVKDYVGAKEVVVATGGSSWRGAIGYKRVGG